MTQPVKNPAAVALGRLGGLKVGKARAAKLSPEIRSEIARVAARRRWDNHHADLVAIRRVQQLLDEKRLGWRINQK